MLKQNTIYKINIQYKNTGKTIYKEQDAEHT